MKNYYFQLVLTLQTKLGETSQKLLHCRQQLKKLVTEEEWVERQRADEELIDSLTHKLDKFFDKLAKRRARKLEKLQNPGAESNPSQEKRIKRTHNESNKGKKPNKAREGIKQRSPSGCRNDRRDEPRVQQRNTHQLKGGKERLPRASQNKTTPITYLPAQVTSIDPSPYYVNQIPAWPHPLMMSQMTPWVPDSSTGKWGISATRTIEGIPTTSTILTNSK